MSKSVPFAPFGARCDFHRTRGSRPGLYSFAATRLTQISSGY